MRAKNAAEMVENLTVEKEGLHQRAKVLEKDAVKLQLQKEGTLLVRYVCVTRALPVRYLYDSHQSYPMPPTRPDLT